MADSAESKIKSWIKHYRSEAADAREAAVKAQSSAASWVKTAAEHDRLADEFEALLNQPVVTYTTEES